MNIKSFITAVLLAQSIAGWTQSKNFIDQPFVETSALVDTLITPDRIYLNIVILEKDTKGKISVEELEAKMEASLKKLGIDTKENLTLNDLASNFKKYFLRPQDVLKSKAYTLMVKDAKTAGAVIIELENIEISNVILERTEFSKMEQLKLDIKSKAVAKARKQAEYMVTPLNQKVGSAIHISDQSDNHFNDFLSGKVSGIQIRGYSSASQEELEPADIEFEKIKVESRVAVTFKLEE
ncbi:MAG: SIMPL domain-containing protein [Bacteroidetes bacterium]|nr:SIMPL domain-containing protein [Bacteroidota bacterium]